VALPCTTAARLASGTLLRGLILVEHARRHDLGPVDHLVVEAEVIRLVRPPSPQIFAVEGRVVERDGRRFLVGVGTEEKVDQLVERGQTVLLEHLLCELLKLAPGAPLPVLEEPSRSHISVAAQSVDDFADRVSLEPKKASCRILITLYYEATIEFIPETILFENFLPGRILEDYQERVKG
jgi:hypothetical protein